MWIESHGNLARHPKTRRLMQRMGWTLPFTLGNLHLLWWWALDFAPDGDLSRFEPEQLTYDLDLGGATPEEFIEAMIHAGFIDRSDEKSRRLHDWLDYTARSSRSSSRRVNRREQTEPSAVSERQVTPAASRDPKLVEYEPLGAARIDCVEGAARTGEVSGSERSQMALRAVPRIHTTGPVNNTSQTYPAPDSTSRDGAPTPPSVVEKTLSPSERAQALAKTTIPRSLDALPSFTDLWWSQLLDIYDTFGDPLSAADQRALLERLAGNPFSAVPKLKAAIKNARNGLGRRELLNSS